MSKKKEKQYKVVAIGKPCIETLPDADARALYSSLLSCILNKKIDSKHQPQRQE